MAKAKKVTSKPEVKPAPKTEAARITGPQKKYLKSRPTCQVTFTLPAPHADKVCLVGEFNNWVHDAHPMKKQKNGHFSLTLELEKGRAYRYRYFVDGLQYENDHCADWYDPNPFGGDDSVVNV